MKRGVPSLYPSGGKDVVGQPEGFGHEKISEYIARHYHQPSDQIDPAWDLSGAVEDARLLFMVGYEVANGDGPPQWKPGAEFSRDTSAMSHAMKRCAWATTRAADFLPRPGMGRAAAR